VRDLLKFLIVTSLAVIVFGSAQQARASMIGDTITINRLYPNLVTLFLSPPPGFVSTVVAAGPSDAVSPQPSLYSINLEANGILFDFLAPSAFVGSAAGDFDGLQFIGFSQAIQNVTVTNVAGITVADLGFGANFINLNLNGAFTASSILDLHVDFVAVSGIPEPATLMLLGMGILGLGFMERKRAA
jgi:hypothetical protein